MLFSFVVEHAASNAAVMATVMTVLALRRERAGNGISDLSPDGSEYLFVDRRREAPPAQWLRTKLSSHAQKLFMTVLIE